MPANPQMLAAPFADLVSTISPATTAPGIFGRLVNLARWFLLLCLVMGLANRLPADQFGDFTYASSGSAITITGYTGTGGEVVIPSLIIGLPVTSIGDFAFFYQSTLTSVTIPTGVTSIGDNAFRSCTGLTSVTIPASVASIGRCSFLVCTGLTSVTIPASVTSIGDGAFSYCTGLTAITVDAANANYSSLAGVLFNKAQTLLILCTGGKTGSYIIPVGVASIGDAAFSSCTGLTRVTIPGSVTSIGRFAFYLCTGLINVTIPASVTSIGDLAFYCTGLAFAVFTGNAPGSFGSSVFDSVVSGFTIHYGNGSTGFTSPTWMGYPAVATVPPVPAVITGGASQVTATTTTLGGTVNPGGFATAAYFEYGLTSAYGNAATATLTPANGSTATTVSASLSGLQAGQTYHYRLTATNAGGSSAGEDRTFVTERTEGDYKFTGTNNSATITGYSGPGGEVSIPATLYGLPVTGIEREAFINQKSLTRVTIPAGVISIGKSAFADCTNLTSVTIPAGVTSIGYAAFAGCTGLTNVTIPTGVTSIGSYAFQFCTGLAFAVFTGNAPSSFGNSVFASAASGFTIHYGKGSTGFTSPTWMDYPAVATVPPVPAVITGGASQVTATTATLGGTVNPDGFATAAHFDFGLTSAYGNAATVTLTPANGTTATTVSASLSGLQTGQVYHYRLTATNAGGSAAGEDRTFVTERTEGDYKFTAANNTATITGYCGPGGEVTIPATLYGLPVTGIEREAFINQTTLTRITIPASVTSIGDSAFYGCTGLTSVTIPAGVASIGRDAFSFCVGLTSVTIPTGVTSIGSSSFSYCRGLTSVTISAGVTSIGDYAFFYCTGLKAIAVDAANANFSSLAGVLFNKAQTLLIQCPGGKTDSYTIPASVTSIGPYAFGPCAGLTSVTIPASVTSIGIGAFSSCTGLAFAVFAGNAPGSFGSSVFASVVSGFTIHYGSGSTGFASPTWMGYPAIATVPPVPTVITGDASQITTQSATLGGTVNPGGFATFARFEYGLTSTYGNAATVTLTPANGTAATTVSVRISGLQADQIYHYRLTATNAGGTSVGTDKTFVTLTSYSYIIRDDGTISITGYSGPNGAVTIPGTINGLPVTSIEDSAFVNRAGLTSVTIPEGCTSIGYGAFAYCTGLTSVSIPKGCTSIGSSAFQNCTGLTSVTIPEGCTSIWSYAFGYCTSLTSVNIPNGVISIDYGAFANCASLTGVTIPTGVTTIGQAAFYGCTGLASVTLPNRVTAIGDNVFNRCTGLTGITIPDSVTSIGQAAFYDCTGLYSVTIPFNVTSIGEFAFDGCTGLTSVTIPDSVTSIGQYAFYGCTSLTSVTIPNSVSSIGKHAFGRCTSLLAISVDARNSGYGSVAGILFDKGLTTLIQCPGGKVGDYAIPTSVTSIIDEAFEFCTSLTSVTIPNSVTSIGNYAFPSCTSLTAITVDAANANYSSLAGVLFDKGLTTLIKCPADKAGDYAIPTSVTGIANRAFLACASLTSITIPASVSNIENYSFAGCTSLLAISVDARNSGFSSVAGVLFDKDVATLIQCPGGMAGSYTIPDSVTGIGQYAFYRCTSLTRVIIPDHVTSIGQYAFQSCTSLTRVTIPDHVTSIGNYAYDSCAKLTSAIFTGDAPAMGTDVFYQAADGFTVYFLNGRTGFTSPTWNGYPAILPAPKISLEQPDGTSITETRTRNFGVVAVGNTASMTFVIRNTGALDLTNLVISKDGANPGDFTVGPLGAATLAPGASTDFSVTFMPTATGCRTADIHIASNDANQNPFDFNLTGNLTLADAIDLSGVFTVDVGITPWLAQTTTSHDGHGAARSGTITDGQDSWMQTTITGPGTLSYWWKVSSESGYDFLEFHLDGLLQRGRISGEVNWQQVSINIPVGSHSVKWRYKKDGATSSGQDAGWVDQVRFISGNPSPVTTWLLANGFTADADLQSDPNGDGVSLLMAYALNLNPKLVLSGSMPRPVVAWNQLSLTFYAGSEGITYMAEISTDLHTWTTTGVTISAPDVNKFRTASVPMTGPSRFLRLGVCQAVVSPLASWLLANGFPAATNLQSDPNGDGVSLLMAYALNLDPNQNLSASMPGPTVAANQLSLTFWGANSDITYSAQSSTDLQSWSTSGVTVSAPNANGIRTATVPMTGARRFMRLVVGH